MPAGKAALVAAGGCSLLAFILLAVQVAADPAPDVTFSHSPFTDEGWLSLGARNLVLLGRWATDEWQLYLVQLPFSVVQAAAFEAFGVGIIQARAVSVAASPLAVALLTLVIGRRIGVLPAVVAGVGLASSALVLYYGRLALLEPMVMLCLIAGLAGFLWRSEAWLIPGVVTGICLSLALATKPSSAAAAAGIVLGGALAASRTPGWAVPVRRGVVAAGVIAIAAAAWWALVQSIPGAWDAILRIWPNQLPASSLAEVVDRVVSYPVESDGAVRLAAPLLIGGAIGLAMVAARWRSLAIPHRVLVGACLGWIVVGFAVLMVVPYRPNRYVVPLLPPLAVLAAFGMWAVLAALGPRLSRPRALALAGLLVLALAAQGSWHLLRWTGRATYALPRIQAELLATMTDGHAVQGAGPTMAMRVPVPAIVTRTNLNTGDLYATHGVRWLLTNREGVPAWADRHPDAWARRELIRCYPWPSGEACLVHVP